MVSWESQSRSSTSGIQTSSKSSELQTAQDGLGIILASRSLTEEKSTIESSLRERCNGIMGVPITFLDRYSPDQFEIIALGNSRDNFTPNKDYINPIKHLKTGETMNGGAINCVLAIEEKEAPKGKVYYTADNANYLVPPYARILIKRRKHEN